MLGNVQLVGPRLAQHFDPHQARRQNHGMQSVDADRFHRVEIFQRLPVFAGKRHVMTNVANGATRFQSSNDVSSDQVLVFHPNRGLREDAALSQHRSTYFGNRRPDVSEDFLEFMSDELLRLGGPASADRLTKRRTDHLLRASCPAFVIARILDHDREVVAAPIMP